jgi:DNA-binding PadR family transcriptional regulator
MRPPTPWSRHSRHHMMFSTLGPEAGHFHHPHEHPGHGREDGPQGHRHHHGPRGAFAGAWGGPFGGPFGGPGGPFGGPGAGFGFGGPRGEQRGRGRRGGRAGRGDVRTAILLLLAEEPMHGYQLMQAVADRTGGAWRLSPGAVYPTIAQLEDEGLVQVSAEGGRKLVTLTDAGREHVQNLGDVDPFAVFGGAGERVDLRGTIGDLIGAAWQLVRAGDPAQLAAAAGVLAETRRQLYLILAGETPTEQPDGGSEAPTT